MAGARCALLILAVGCATFSSAQSKISQEIENLLKLALAGLPKVGMTLIQSVHGPGGLEMVVKLQADEAGRSRRIVLRPLREQGVYVVDDGKSWYIVNSDRHEIFLQDSPQRFRPCPKTRWDLIEENYRLTTVPSERIAGKRVVTILAEPKARELSIRRIAIEPESGAVLRIQVGNAGQMKTVLDTIEARFPVALDRSLFMAPDFEGNRLIRCPSPRSVKKSGEIKSLVGFEPKPPTKLPMGFIIYDTHVLGKDGEAFLGYRLSDGFVTATLYQWSEHSKLKDAPFDTSEAIRNNAGVMFVLRGDLPEAARKKLLQAFLERMKFQAAVYGELPNMRSLLDVLRQLSEMEFNRAF